VAGSDRQLHHIYDNVNIEGGRPAKPIGGSLAEVADEAIIGDHCWINHGAVMHGTQIADGGAVGIGSACDYDTRIGKNGVLANGSALRVSMVICDGCFFEGVPAVLKRKGLTETDRASIFGVSPWPGRPSKATGRRKTPRSAWARSRLHLPGDQTRSGLRYIDVVKVRNISQAKAELSELVPR